MLSLLLLQAAVVVDASSEWSTVASLDASALALRDNTTVIVVGGSTVWSVIVNRHSANYSQVRTIASNSSADYQFTAVAVDAGGSIAYVTANTLAYDDNQQLQGRLYAVTLTGHQRGSVRQLIGDTDFAFTGIALTADGQIFITGAQVQAQTD